MRCAGLLNLQKASVLLMRGVREDNVLFFSLATWFLLKMSWFAQLLSGFLKATANAYSDNLAYLVARNSRSCAVIDFFAAVNGE